jgi:fatty acid desaturase
MTGENDTLENKIRELEQKIEDMSRKIGDEVEEHVRGVRVHVHRREGRGVFWGLLFILVGLVWLGNSVGWFDFDVPLLPSALIVVGLIIIFSSRRD